MLRDEIARYTELSGNDGEHTPIGIIGAYLDGYEKGLESRENIKGEWIKIKSGDKDFPESIVCSKCKNENSHLDFNEHGEPIGKVFVTSKFCPNCGADMRGE